MKKLVLLLGLFIIIPLCKMQAWNLEDYFGVYIGMSIDEFKTAIKPYYNKLCKFKIANNEDPQKTIMLNSVENTNPDIPADMLFQISFSGMANGVGNEASMFFHMVDTFNLNFTDSLTFAFQSGHLTFVEIQNILNIKGSNKGVSYFITSYPEDFSGQGYYRTYNTLAMTRYGNGGFTEFQNIKKGLYATIYHIISPALYKNYYEAARLVTILSKDRNLNKNFLQ